MPKLLIFYILYILTKLFKFVFSWVSYNACFRANISASDEEKVKGAKFDGIDFFVKIRQKKIFPYRQITVKHALTVSLKLHGLKLGLFVEKSN